MGGQAAALIPPALTSPAPTGRAASIQALRQHCPQGKRRDGTHWKTAESRAAAVQRLRVGRLSRECTWRPIRIPQRCHPLARRLFELMNEQQATLTQVAAAIGATRECFYGWRYRSTPQLTTLIAAFNHLGYDLRPMSIPEADRWDVPAPPTVLRVLGRALDLRGMTPGQRLLFQFLAEARRPHTREAMRDAMGTTLPAVAVYLVKIRKALAAHGLELRHERLGGYQIGEKT